MSKYRDHQGRVLFVSDGISQGTTWMTVYFKNNGVATKRVASKYLPLRDSREAAQADLDQYAKERCLERVVRVG